MDFFKKLFAGSTDKAHIGDSPSDWQTFLGGESMPVMQLSTTQKVKDLVFMCIDKRADTVSSLDFELVRAIGRDGEVKPLENHDVLDLVNMPNEYTTKENFIYTISAQLDVFGTVYIRIKRDKGSKPTLHIIPKTQVEKNMSSDRLSVLSYRVSTGAGQFYTVSADDMVALKNPSMFGMQDGDGIVERISDLIEIQHLLPFIHKRMLYRGSIMNVVLETETTDQDSLELAKHGFKQKYEGINNAYETPVLPEGYKVKEISGKTAKDMDFANMDARYTQKIFDAFGTPKEIFGNLDGKGVANGENAHRAFLEFTIKPVALQIQAQLNHFLLPKLTKDPIFFNLDNIVPEDSERALNHKKTALAGNAWKKVNEVRADEGLDPVEGGDEIPSSGLSIDFDGDDEPEETPEGDEPNNNDDEKKLKKSMDMKKRHNKAVKTAPQRIEKKKTAKIPAHARKALDKQEESKSAIDTTTEALMEVVHSVNHKAFIDRNDENVAKVTAIVARVDEKMRKDVIKNIRSQNQKTFATKAEANSVFNEAKAVEEMEDALEKILIEIAVVEGIKEMAQLPDINQFDPNDESLIKEIKRVLRLHSTAYTNTTAKQLSKALVNAGKEGITAVEMEVVAGDVFKQAYRHERIGANLTYAIANKGSLNAYKQSGIVKTKVWRTAEDEMVCPLCSSINGKEIDVNENFFDGGSSTYISFGGSAKRYDFFDDVDSGHAHANCRCKIIPGRIEI